MSSTRNESAKREILDRIRTAQKLSHTPEHVEPVREYRTTSDHTPEQLREILIDRLLDYKATVVELSLIHISEPTRRTERSRMPSSA